MRHPRRKRNLALVSAGLGVVAMLVALGFSRMNSPGTGLALLGVLGFHAGIIGAAMAVVEQVRVVRRYDRLRRDEGILVRWLIDGARWRTFRESVAALDRTAPALPNALKLPGEIPPEGIEIKISAEAFLLGPEFESLEKNAVVRLIGPVLEIQQRVPENRYRTRLAAYRLPAPEDAEADVARLAQRYNIQATTSRTLVRKAAWVALMIAVATLIGIVVWVMSVVQR